MKGILLAGGAGTRLHPLTRGLSKQLLPIYDKPMIYYPLSVLMLGGIRDVLVITTPRDRAAFQATLGDGSDLGMRLTFVEQQAPRGIAEAFVLGESFIAGEPVCLVLGDNVFYGDSLPRLFETCAQLSRGAQIFAYYVRDANRYGVIELAPDGRPLSIEEKPAAPRSPYAIPGLYFYDAQVVALAKALRPSARGELEITDINRAYLERGELTVRVLGRGNAWLDTGSPEALLQASNFIQTIEVRQGLKIGCLEEIAFRKGFITADQLRVLGDRLANTEYGQYVLQVAREG